MNFNGPVYNSSRGSGHTERMNETKNYLDFSLQTIWDNPGARRIPKRLGRGQGSGKGKTSGRGMKGTYARAGG